VSDLPRLFDLTGKVALVTGGSFTTGAVLGVHGGAA
jgi:hypothetical protein